MKEILKLLCASLFFLLILNCKKDKCNENITNSSNVLISFDKINCIGGEFQNKYNSYDAFLKDTTCSWSNLAAPLFFDGIIITQGIKVKYVGPNGGDPGYVVKVDLCKNECDKEIDFNLILETIDTSRSFNNYYKTVLIMIDGIDSTYKINYNHEIIPYKE